MEKSEQCSNHIIMILALVSIVTISNQVHFPYQFHTITLKFHINTLIANTQIKLSSSAQV